MDLCEDYGIPPFFCLVVQEYELPKADSVKDSVALAKKQIAASIDKCIVHPLFGASGQPKNSILLQCEDRESFAIAKELICDGYIQLKDLTYPISYVYERTPTFAQKSENIPYQKVPLRKLKLFSGSEKVGSGEVDAREWLSQANDLIENEKQLQEKEKMRILRNSLIKHALLLISSSEVNTCREILDLIALTYGEAHSAAHLRFKFYQMQQGPSESASTFLSRLQETLKEYARVDVSIKQVEPEIRFKVFTEGLRPDYFDLMNIHIGLEMIDYRKDYPDFPTLLRLVQSFERNRRERFERSHETQCAAVNSIPYGKNLEPSTSKSFNADSTMQQELLELKKQMSNLMAGKSKKNKPQQQSAACGEVTVEAEPAPAPKYRTNYRGRKPKCWNCGTIGHTVFACTQEWDATAVKAHVDSTRQRIQNAQKQKESQPATLPTEDQKN